MSYIIFRRILMILAKNKELASLINGGEIDLDFKKFLAILEKTDLDVELIEVITDKKADDLDAMEGIEALRDFYEYIGSNTQRLSDCLSSLGLKGVAVEKVEKPTGTG